mmetsp:Transcript_14982/g.46977  ORF Transcript_14982/g.46977 Transcript_14982/m.46977 type:complete len:520 (-) Transcript_14982:90-1649(-)
MAKAQPALAAVIDAITSKRPKTGKRSSVMEKEIQLSIASWSSQHPPHVAKSLLQANGRWETATRHTSNQYLTFQLAEPEAVAAIEFSLAEAATDPKHCRVQFSAASVVGPWTEAWSFTVSPSPGQACFKSSHSYVKTQNSVSELILNHCGGLDAAWRLVDPNGTGVLCIREFKHLCNQLQQEEGLDLLAAAALQDVPALFQELDIYGTGKVKVTDLLRVNKFEPPKATWWRLLILDNHGSPTCITLGAPLRLFGPPERPQISMRRRNRRSSETCKVTAFHPETVGLKPEVRILREVAKSYNRPLTELEDIYEHFHRDGLDQSAEISREAFEGLLLGMLGLPECDVQKVRFEFCWKQMDRDGNGKINFAEFMAWYRSNFQQEPDGGPEGSMMGEQLLEMLLESKGREASSGCLSLHDRMPWIRHVDSMRREEECLHTALRRTLSYLDKEPPEDQPLLPRAHAGHPGNFHSEEHDDEGTDSGSSHSGSSSESEDSGLPASRYLSETSELSGAAGTVGTGLA